MPTTGPTAAGGHRPGGLEHGFRLIDTAGDDVELGPLVAACGCEADLAATQPSVEKYQLSRD